MKQFISDFMRGSTLRVASGSRKFPITIRPIMNNGAKEEKIKQVSQQRTLGLTFYTRMEHNKNTKARAEKIINIIKCLAHTTWGPDQNSLLKVHQMIVLGYTIRGTDKNHMDQLQKQC
jgi:hypothetical protein